MKKILTFILAVTFASSVAWANSPTHDGSGTGTFTLHSGMITGDHLDTVTYQTQTLTEPLVPELGQYGMSEDADSTTLTNGANPGSDHTHVVVFAYGATAAPSGVTFGGTGMNVLWADTTPKVGIYWAEIAVIEPTDVVATWDTSQAIVMQVFTIRNGVSGNPFRAVAAEQDSVSGAYALNVISEENDIVLGFFTTSNQTPTFNNNGVIAHTISAASVHQFVTVTDASGDPDVVTQIAWSQAPHPTDYGKFAGVAVKWSGEYQITPMDWSEPLVWNPTNSLPLTIPVTENPWGIRVEAQNKAGGFGWGERVVGYAGGGAAPQFSMEFGRFSVTNTSTSTTIPVGASIPPGSAVVVLVNNSTSSQSSSTVTDSAGNTYTKSEAYNVGGATYSSALYYSILENSLSSSSEIYVGWTSDAHSAKWGNVIVVDNVSGVDTHAQNFTYGSSVSIPGTLTTSPVVTVGQVWSSTVSKEYLNSAWTVLPEHIANNRNTYYLHSSMAVTGSINPNGNFDASVNWGGSWIAFY